MMNGLYLIAVILIGEHLVTKYVASRRSQLRDRLCRIVTVCGVFWFSMQTNTLSFKKHILIVLMCSLIYVAYIDICVQKIPNAYIIMFVGLWIVSMFVTFDIVLAIGGLSIVAIIMALTHVISKGGIGAGDIKLLASIGLHVGVFHILPVLFWVCSVLMLTSIGLLLVKKATLKTVLPMGPFIAIGTILYIQQHMLLIAGN